MITLQFVVIFALITVTHIDTYVCMHFGLVDLQRVPLPKNNLDQMKSSTTHHYHMHIYSAFRLPRTDYLGSGIISLSSHFLFVPEGGYRILSSSENDFHA